MLYNIVFCYVLKKRKKREMIMLEQETELEKFVLVGIVYEQNQNIEEDFKELQALVETAGGIVVGTMAQNREELHRTTYLGKGKVEELKTMVTAYEADGIVCNDELSVAQLKQLQEHLDCKILDRTMVILDIFAKRAITKEGKIQVELAQLKDRASRLTGFGTSLSRQGGGIGSKGPGEKKLELDRRQIQRRMVQLKKELEDVKQTREMMREKRKKIAFPVGAIVGYTNAGKSTLFNALTNAGVREEDQLFATLDPITRGLELENGQKVLLVDTVGFIQKLPHQLIDAFRSTLEEAKYADFILHVIDAANENAMQQLQVVQKTLQELEVEKPIIYVWNKQDKVSSEQMQLQLEEAIGKSGILLSSKTGDGFEELFCAIKALLQKQTVCLEQLFSYEEAGKIAKIRKYGQLLEESYRADGIWVRAYIKKEWL